jgi:hypothetical protein
VEPLAIISPKISGDSTIVLRVANIGCEYLVDIGSVPFLEAAEAVIRPQSCPGFSIE